MRILASIVAFGAIQLAAVYTTFLRLGMDGR